MSWLGDVAKFEGFQLKDWGRKIKENPEQLLIGAGDPFSAKVWSKITGKDYEPFVDQMGGAYGGSTISAFGKDDGGVYQRARDAGIDTGAGGKMHDLAHVIAALYAGSYASDAMGGASGGAGGVGETGGSVGGDAAGSGGSASSGSGFNWQRMVGNALSQQSQQQKQQGATAQQLAERDRAEQMALELRRRSQAQGQQSAAAPGWLDMNSRG